MSSPEKNKKSLLSPCRYGEDAGTDNLLRPASFVDYIGQDKVKRNLKVIIEAARKRKDAVDHLLFYGQAGLGKTTLANLVAKEMRTEIKITSGPVIEKTGDLAAILSSLDDGDILFIDEIHRINRNVEEMLYPALESRVLNLVIGKGPGARMLSINLPAFTLIGATTRVNLISSPLRSRFGGIFRLDYYDLDQIEKIIKRSANIIGVEISDEAVMVLAKASRFTPRIANRLLKRVRDLAQVEGDGFIDKDMALRSLEMLEIDELGLENHDRKLIEVLIEKFNGGPVGVMSLAALVGEERGVIEDVYEPYLLKAGLIARTRVGRIATDEAFKHLGYDKK